ncbi:MAG TPA: FecR family protein [Arachidicoccus sp.]|nr:FecR family protein [Arachidicoccus sp.]
MDLRNQIWELLSKSRDGSLSEKEKLQLEHLLEQPELQEAVQLYKRLEAYWQQVAQSPVSQNQAAVWMEHKARFLDKYLRISKIEDETTKGSIPSGIADAVIATQDALSTAAFPGAALSYTATDSTDASKPAQTHFEHRSYRIMHWPWKRIAAIIIFTIGLGWFIRQYTQPGLEAVIVQNGAQKHLMLPDGSQVWLNSGSQLTYDKDFINKRIREVTLSGEGFFDIKHDPEHSFIIHTKLVDIKDIGTRFNVKAYPEDEMVETTLLKGAVEVYSKDAPDHIVRLKPNEKIIFNASTRVNKIEAVTASGSGTNNNGKIPQENEDSLAVVNQSRVPAGFSVKPLQPTLQASGEPIISETAWMQHQLVFNAQSFSELARNMERWYDVNIQFDNDQAADFVFSGIFKEENVTEALSELQMIQSFQFKQSGKEIRIY